jgi:hypothetical protein
VRVSLEIQHGIPRGNALDVRSCHEPFHFLQFSEKSSLIPKGKMFVTLSLRPGESRALFGSLENLSTYLNDGSESHKADLGFTCLILMT